MCIAKLGLWCIRVLHQSLEQMSSVAKLRLWCNYVHLAYFLVGMLLKKVVCEGIGLYPSSKLLEL